MTRAASVPSVDPLEDVEYLLSRSARKREDEEQQTRGGGGEEGTAEEARWQRGRTRRGERQRRKHVKSFRQSATIFPGVSLSNEELLDLSRV